MTTDTESGLGSLASHHWRWISESFVHVLMLHEWGERTLSARIDDEYRREVPRAFRMIEIMLESGCRISLHDPRTPYAQLLLDPGRSVAEMRERERVLMESFDPELRELATRFADAGLDEAAAMSREALSSRREYVRWLSDPRNCFGQATERSCRVPADSQACTIWQALNRLLAEFFAAIDETSVHMLVLRHLDEKREAESAWQDSYAYMLLATDLIQLFARRGWALELRAESPGACVSPPRIGATAAGIRDSDRARRAVLIELSANAVERIAVSGDSEVDEVVRAIARRLAGERGSLPPSGRSFDAMLRGQRYPPE